MARLPVNPALLDDLIERCRSAFAAEDGSVSAAEAVILTDLEAVRDHLVATEQRELGEWIRDLPSDELGEFLADMEVSARQADADSDIGSFISAIADWQTTAEAHRNGWNRD